jgi:CheY-like chemotaxis protein
VSSLSWRRLRSLATRTGTTMSEVLDQVIGLAATHPTVAGLLAEDGLEVREDDGDAPIAFDGGPAEARARRERPLVLVLEDDVESTELLRLRLEFIGCDVVATDRVADAIAIARDQQPGLMIVDLNLHADPAGGLGFITEVRASAETAAIPIAIHSIYVRHRADLPRPLPRVEALLPKPFKLKQLVDLVKNHCADLDEAARVTII